jgi:hypothetical protein
LHRELRVVDVQADDGQLDGPAEAVFLFYDCCWQKIRKEDMSSSSLPDAGKDKLASDAP